LTQIQQNRYDQLLRRVADLKGPGSKINDALTELFPMLDVENLPAELLLLSGSRLCLGTVAIGSGGAGNFTHTFLRNPGGSGVVARVVQVGVWSSIVQTFHFGITTNSDVASGDTAFADGRVFGEGTVVVTQGNNNLLVTGPTFFRKRHDTNFDTVFEPPVACAVLSPGTAFIVSSDTNNSGHNTSFVWIERQAQPSELNL